MRRHWRAMFVVLSITGVVVIVGLAATIPAGNGSIAPSITVPTSLSASALPGPTLARAIASPSAAIGISASATDTSPPTGTAADCARPIAASVASSLTASPAIPVADVLCLVAAAPAMTVVPVDLVPPLEQAEADYGIPTADHKCVAYDGIAEVPDCVFGDPAGSRTVMILGDSHAYSWLPAFDQIGKRLRWKVILLSKSSCTPAYLSTYNIIKKTPFTDCDRWHDYAIARINQTHPDMVVFISISGATLGQGVYADSAVWQAAMVKTVTLITTPNARKVLFASLPRADIGNPPNQATGPNCLAAHLNDVQTCSASREIAVRAATQTQEQAAATQTGARYIDIYPLLCSQKVCTAVVGKMNVYVHDGHLSATYATYVSGALQAELQPIMDLR